MDGDGPSDLEDEATSNDEDGSDVNVVQTSSIEVAELHDDEDEALRDVVSESFDEMEDLGDSVIRMVLWAGEALASEVVVVPLHKVGGGEVPDFSEAGRSEVGMVLTMDGRRPAHMIVAVGSYHM